MPQPAILLSILCLSILQFAQSAMAARTAPVAGTAAGHAADVCGLRDAAGASDVRLPFELVDGRIYVQARVDDAGPFRFAVDTGASGIGRADATLVEALGLRRHGRASTSDGVRTATVDTVQLGAIALGGLERTGVEVITRDYSSRLPAGAGFHGILARDFFADGLLVLDYPRKTLSFSRTMSLPAMGEGVIRYERAFRVPVSVGGVRTHANLDTGANVGVVMPKSLYMQVGRAPLEPAGEATLTNTRIATWRAVVPGPLVIGATSLSQVEARISDTFPELLVGAHLLQKFVVLIDQRAKRVALCAP